MSNNTSDIRSANISATIREASTSILLLMVEAVVFFILLHAVWSALTNPILPV
jgi:hypothetical protein